ncbi:hypothetical protein [Aquimarina megaterium]|uniref:hypothetical protein n=1 Tax=Aquimarina megaterium TaxID=1443666 RepID=UPI001111D66E|nr:hypothetical protein [Aquimarina megaterium]
MKNYKIALVIVLLLCCMSCGTRKRTMQRTEVQTTKIEKRDIVKNETQQIETNAFIIRETDKIIYTPKDNSKPMKIGEKEYKNTKIEIVTTKEIDSTKTKEKKISNTSDKSKIKTDKKEDNKKVEVERDNSFNFWDWIWLFLAAGVVYYVFKKRKSIISWFV